jgi:ribosomal-protein-alanine N-acetyltransferase
MSTGNERDARMVSLLWASHDMAAEIAGLHAGEFDPAWDAASVSKMMENPGSTVLVARTGFPKASVGFVMAQLAADEAEILSIAVEESWQRKGLGRRLVDGIVRALATAGARRVHLEVAEDNAAALALYGRCGFTATGRRKGYYTQGRKTPVDALVLTRTLA